jgi:hypothetical protein
MGFKYSTIVLLTTVGRAIAGSFDLSIGVPVVMIEVHEGDRKKSGGAI